MKKCPFCAEEIQDEAKKCKHCGEWISEDNRVDEYAYEVSPIYTVRKRRMFKYDDHKVTREQLKEWADKGRIKPKDEIWDPLSQKWQYAKDCTELFIGKILIELPNALWSAYRSNQMGEKDNDDVGDSQNPFRGLPSCELAVCLTVFNMINTICKNHFLRIVKASGIRIREDHSELEELSFYPGQPAFLCLVFASLVVWGLWSKLPLFLETTEKQNELRDSIWQHNLKIISESAEGFNVIDTIDELFQTDKNLVSSTVLYMSKNYCVPKENFAILHRELEFLAYNIDRYLMPAIEQNLC